MLCSVDIPQLPPFPPLPPPGFAQGPQPLPLPNKHNFFASVCEPGSPDPVKHKPVTLPSPGTPPVAVARTPVLEPCGQTTPTLKLWRSSCGGIHIPLDYANIRIRKQLDGSQRTRVKRWLYGQSGAGRETDADSKRIYVPGREFVGSTPDYDSSSRRADTNWRLPELDVWYPDGQEGAEFGLKGVADKDESIIHVFPRIPAIYVCAKTATGTDIDPPRGCMGVGSQGTHCSCEESYGPGCTCERLSVGGQFFACEGGDRANMPCTRDAHCKSRDTSRESGTCSRHPICRPGDTVWRRKPLSIDPDPEGAVYCESDGQCEDGEQCGYSLFDFKTRVDVNGWYYLDRDVALLPTSGRIRRGACAHDRELVCSNAGLPNFPEICPDSNRCRGYRLVAGDEK